MGEIDPVQFGQMIQAVKNLSENMMEMKEQIDEMSQEIKQLTDVKNKGSGILIGIGLAGGSMGAFATHLLEKIMK